MPEWKRTSSSAVGNGKYIPSDQKQEYNLLKIIDQKEDIKSRAREITQCICEPN